MTRVVSFGEYEFPARWTQFDTNFGDAVPRTVRLPGMDGGYDEFGDDPAPTEIGNVKFRLRVSQPGMDLTSQGTAMQALRDALRGLAAQGRQVLVIEPSGGTAQRWTMARINSVQASERLPAETDRIQDFVFDFQVSDPRWYSDNAASGTVEACGAGTTSFTRSNGGNALTVPVITVVAGTAALASGVTVRRVSGGTVLDRAQYAGTVAAGGTLVIDCRALSVTLAGSAAYGTAFSYDHPAWLRIPPGDNDYQVVLGAGQSADVTFEWDDAWY